MNKLYPSLALLSATLIFSNQLHAWAKNPGPFPDTTPVAEPVNDRDGLFEIDYLFWKPYQEDLNFALKASESVSPDNSTIIFNLRPKNPDFDISSGVRVGFGGYTSDEWDVKVRGTYLYSDARKEAHASGDKEFLYPSFFPILEGEDGTRASAYWRLNFGLVDLTLGRETCLSRKFTLHPFIGVRSVWIRETLKGKFKGVVPDPSIGGIPFPGTYKHTNDVWGIGPRAGFDSRYYFARDWSLQGGLSGAFVIGNFRAYQRLSNLNTLGLQTIKHNLKDSQDLIRVNLDGFLGLGWDRWFNQGKNRIYLALLCETSYWFGINQLMDFITAIDGLGAPAHAKFVNKRHGDLALFGGTLHFQLDF